MAAGKKKRPDPLLKQLRESGKVARDDAHGQFTLLNEFLDTAEALKKKGALQDIPPETMILMLEDRNDAFKKTDRPEIYSAVYRNLYYTFAPHVGFSRSFTQHLTRGVNIWAKGLDVTQEEWVIGLGLDVDPMGYLQQISVSFDKATDPDGAIYTGSNRILHRDGNYQAIHYDTREFAAGKTPGDNFETLKKAHAHISRRAAYNARTDSIALRRAFIPGDLATFKATGKTDKDGAMMLAMCKDALFQANGNGFYMSKLGNSGQNHYVMGHEKIHQHTLRSFYAYKADIDKRRKFHFSFHDAILTEASVLCYHRDDPRVHAENKLETLATDTLRQTSLHDKVKEAFRLD